MSEAPVSNADEDAIRAFFAKTDDPAHRSLQRMVLGWALDAFPEERAKIMEAAELRQARAVVCRVLAARRLALTAEEAARVEECTSLEVLTRWLRQAVVAANAVDALR